MVERVPRDHLVSEIRVLLRVERHLVAIAVVAVLHLDVGVGPGEIAAAPIPARTVTAPVKL